MFAPAMNTPTNNDSDERASLTKLRSQISNEIEAMQQKEYNLREYEKRLRRLVEQSQGGQFSNPAAAPAGPATPGKADLDAEWEKYQRAHALLEAARRGLCDDRLALKDREEKFQQRETEVARREAWIKVRELELEAQAQMRAKEFESLKEKPKPKQLSSFTVAPFLAARKLLSRQT